MSVSDFLTYEILFSGDTFKMYNYSHGKISRFIKKSLGSRISDIHMKQEENAGGETLLHYSVPSPLTLTGKTWTSKGERKFRLHAKSVLGLAPRICQLWQFL